MREVPAAGAGHAGLRGAGKFMQGFVQSPAFRHQLGYLVPQGAVCLQKFLGVCCAETGGSGHGLRAEVEDLFVKRLEHGEARAVAKRDGIAKHCLLACEPGCVEAHVLNWEVGCLVKEGRADELGLCTERA